MSFIPVKLCLRLHLLKRRNLNTSFPNSEGDRCVCVFCNESKWAALCCEMTYKFFILPILQICFIFHKLFFYFLIGTWAMPALTDMEDTKVLKHPSLLILAAPSCRSGDPTGNPTQNDAQLPWADTFRTTAFQHPLPSSWPGCREMGFLVVGSEEVHCPLAIVGNYCAEQNKTGQKQGIKKIFITNNIQQLLNCSNSFIIEELTIYSPHLTDFTDYNKVQYEHNRILDNAVAVKCLITFAFRKT